MTSAPIHDFTAVQGYRSTKGADGGISKEDAFGNFQNAMDHAKGSRTDSVKNAAHKNSAPGNLPYAAKATGKEDGTGKADEASGTEKDLKTELAQEDETVRDDKTIKDAVDKALEETEKEAVSEVAGELEVSEEEVVAAMEALGLTVMDLLNPANMAALIQQINGEGDPLALLTDENLFLSVSRLTEQVAAVINENAGELSETLDMDIGKVLTMMEQVLAQEAENTDSTVPEAVVIEVDQTAETKDGLQAKTQDITATDSLTDEAATEKQEGIAELQADDKGQNQSLKNANQENTPFVNQLYQPETNTSVQNVNADLPFASHVDTENIIRQIADYVRIHNTEGLSEMELSLNPESLGRIHLQVVSKEGAITATITAQNETVREALMVQAVTLKEELNEQGLKVDAVEVTIASHAFERNTESGGKEAQNLFEEQVKKQARRRIVIDSLKQAEEMLSDETLSDAEKLQIDMMAKSGSSVDFTA